MQSRRLAVATLALAATTCAPPPPTHAAATSATCYSLRGLMKDETPTRARSAASNVLPLGTRITLTGRPFYRGMRRFVIRDTGAPWALGDGHLDLWHQSRAACLAWGRRPVSYVIGWRS